MRKFIALVSVILITSACCKIADTNSTEVSKDIIKRNLEKVRWENLVYALCQVESGCDDAATNHHSTAAGRFQMLRGYVDEVNRIKRKKIYTYNDRFNPIKAREMFEIYQAHHNPKRDIDKAIIIHRGKISKKYIKKVKEEMRHGRNKSR